MEEKTIHVLWQEISQVLRRDIAESAWQRWLAPLVPISLTEDNLTIAAPNHFSLDRVRDRFIPFIGDAAQEVLGKDVRILLIVPEGGKDTENAMADDTNAAPLGVHDEEAAVYDVQTTDAPTASSVTPTVETTANAATPAEQTVLLTADTSNDGERSALSPIAPGDGSSLNPLYTFDMFVEGSSNRLAYAAARAVANNPGGVYNPLFLYGGVGLGKTHLMHAIGNEVLKKHPEMRVLYISSEKFTNEFINAVLYKTPEAFRQKYRTIDVLLVDDVQFLHEKVQTQEEFFHTFNTLFDAKKAIILSSDRHPRNIETLEDRMRSRFECGLTADVQAPDLETRIAILKKKAIIEHIDVPTDVLYYIASRIDNNIRELEGALTRVVAYAQLDKKQITIDLVAEAMKGVYENDPKKVITSELIMDIVASHFSLRKDDFTSKKRTRQIAFPRQIAMYLCRELIDLSLPQIGLEFGGRDHTTVIHACRTIARDSESDKSLHDTIELLRKRIENS